MGQRLLAAIFRAINRKILGRHALLVANQGAKENEKEFIVLFSCQI